MAFDAIVALHQNRIYNLCYWMLGNRDDAADAAQDAFVLAFRSLDRFRGDSSFATWLHRIAVNASLDAAQRRKRGPLLYSDLECGDDSPPELDPVDYGQDPQRISARRERSQAVRAAMAELPEHYRIVLVLFDLENHSYDEVAELLSLPLGTVKSRLNRARLALRDKLETEWELFRD
jgi:RNA polymerase sigma-70 factor (ECF subfamily)